jgi:predicted PurR-regulated permease PerM
MSSTEPSHAAVSVIERRSPSWLVTFGIRAWLAVGIVAFVILAALGIGAAASLVLPMVIAGIVGALFAPLVERLVAVRVPRIVAALLVILGLSAIVVATIIITVVGVAGQVDEIKAQVVKGMAELTSVVESAGVNVDQATAATDAAKAPSQLVEGALGNLGGLFSSLGAILFGAFVTAFLLFYALMDWTRFETWAGARLGVPEPMGRRIVDDAVHDLRLYFSGLTISSIVVAVIIGTTMWVLDLPLAFTVAVVTYVTAYIPYVGAILSGTFAFIVALGTGGLPIALAVLAVVLVTQNVVQAIIQTRVTSGGLQVHPAVNFASTILGAIIAGAIGAIVAAPLVATLLKAKRVLEQQVAAETASGTPP